MSGQPPGSLTQEIQIQVVWGRAQTWAIFPEFPGNLSMQSELIAIDPTAYLKDSKHLSPVRGFVSYLKILYRTLSTSKKKKKILGDPLP